MTKASRNNIISLMRGLMLIGGLAIFFIANLHYSYFFVLLILTAIIPEMIGSTLPKAAKSNKKNLKQSNKSSKTTNKINNGTSYNIMPMERLLKSNLSQMSGFDFEELCFQYFKHNVGYVEQTPFTKDKGVDFIFKDEEGFRVAVQVKHRIESGKKITVSEINELNGARRMHRCQRAMFITSTSYSKDAENHAQDLHIVTKEKHWVELKVLKWQQQEAKKRKLIS